MPETIRLKASWSEATKRLSEVDHKTFQKVIKKNWRRLESGDVAAHSICWLYCWGKTGMSSEKAAAEARRAFDSIFNRNFDWLDARIDHDTARALRYNESPKVESQFAETISRRK